MKASRPSSGGGWAAAARGAHRNAPRTANRKGRHMGNLRFTGCRTGVSTLQAAHDTSTPSDSCSLIIPSFRCDARSTPDRSSHALRSCLVTFQDPRGSRHSVEVFAGSLYEAVVLANGELK